MTETRGRPFRWAILGTGPVARKFVLDLQALKGVAEVRCVASRDPENARRFARDLGVAEAVRDYAAAAAADVDALYIATPPAQHEDHALLGIAAGKAVLVEKPFALDAAAAGRIAAAAEAAGVFCMEAMWTRFQPLPGLIRDKVAAGAIGSLRGFEAHFMAANRPDPGVSLFDPARGGGALMHRGIYPLSLARFLLGPVVRQTAEAVIGETGVDEDCALVLRHASGAVSTLRASLRTGGPEGAVLYGTGGTLYIEGPIWRPTGAVLHPARPAGPPGGLRRFEAFRETGTGLRIGAAAARLRRVLRPAGTRIAAPFAGNGYRHEAEAVMQALAEGRREDPRMPLAESVELMALIDAARAEWREGGTA